MTRRFDLLVLLVISLFIVARPQAAWSGCFATTTNISFGTVNIGSLSGATSTGTINEGCTPGLLTLGTLAICNSIGVGANSVSQSNRTMKNGVNSLSYQVYSDPSYTTVFNYPGGDLFTIPYSTLGGGSTNATIYSKILGSPAGLPPGTYTDSYTTTAMAVATFDSTGLSLLQCGDTLLYASSAIVFTVSATLASSCDVTTTNMVFPTAGVIQTTIDATSTLSITCTSTTPYNVGLSSGTGAGATTAIRKMTGSGGATVDYTLYRDAARAQLWGAAIGIDTVAGTGTGSAQAITVYGRVPAQTTPAPGFYSDTINVTVTY